LLSIRTPHLYADPEGSRQLPELRERRMDQQGSSQANQGNGPSPTVRTFHLLFFAAALVAVEFPECARGHGRSGDFGTS